MTTENQSHIQLIVVSLISGWACEGEAGHRCDGLPASSLAVLADAFEKDGQDDGRADPFKL